MNCRKGPFAASAETGSSAKVPGSRLALAAVAVSAVLLTASIASSAACRVGACAASYGPTDDYGSHSCCYVADGPGQYVAVLNAGGFEIYVDGELAVWGWGSTEPAGSFTAQEGQIVTVRTQCDRGVYCTAYAAFGAVVAGDQQ